MKLILSNFTTATVTLLAGVSALAVPLQRSDVAAEPAWVLHVDCDRLRPTAVGQYIIAETEKPGAKAKLASFQAMFKFDLRTQLHGLTLYSVGDSPEEGVLLVYADFDNEHLTTIARGANEYKEATHNQHVIHSWIDHSKNGEHSRKRTYAAAHGSRVLVFGQQEASVSKALDVMDLTAANLSASKSFPALDSKSAFLQAAAQKLTLSGSDPNAAVFRMTKSLRFELGEEQNKVTARLRLTANDDEVARQIASIGQGLLSLMKLQRDRPEANKLAEGLSLKQDATEVTVDLSISSGDAIETLKADAARKAKKGE